LLKYRETENTDMARVLATPPFFGKFSDAIGLLVKAGYEVIRSPYPHPVKENELMQVIGEMEAAIVGMDEMTGDVIRMGKQLRVIARYGVGLDTVDVETATKQGVIVTNAVGANENAVADLVFGLILCLARKISRADVSVKQGKWESIVGINIWQKTLGVIGTGKIGRRVIKRAQGFDMNILAYDISPDPVLTDKLGVQYVSLEDLLRKSDFITLHIPLTPETTGLIGEKQINLVKKTAYLINTARGKVVDEKTLFIALKEKKLAGAALDVFSQEPPGLTDLFTLDNILTTPHMAAHTEEALRKMDLICVENIVRVLNGKEPLSAVNFPLPKAH
jgi:D-3-phosphoglycerate dehydrogenase